MFFINLIKQLLEIQPLLFICFGDISRQLFITSMQSICCKRLLSQLLFRPTSQISQCVTLRLDSGFLLIQQVKSLYQPRQKTTPRRHITRIKVVIAARFQKRIDKCDGNCGVRLQAINPLTQRRCAVRKTVVQVSILERCLHTQQTLHNCAVLPLLLQARQLASF